MVIFAAAALAGCGGGGGGIGPIEIAASNRDAVAHAAAAAVYTMSPAAGLPIAGSAQDAGMLWRRPTAKALSARILSAAQAPTAARSGTRRALAVIGPVVESCSFGGTVSVTYDDRDSNSAPSAGDVMTLVFSNCGEWPDETYNGTAVATYTLVSQFPLPSVSARVAMTQLSMTAAQHALRLDGTALVDFRDQGPSGQLTRITAEGAVVAAVTTHQFSDTVTMRHGFWVESIYDPFAAPPPGGVVTGRNVSTLQGAIESTAAGGVLNVFTVAGAPIVDYDADPYPRSGAIRVTSGKGTLLLTALSPAQVRLELDADDNGTPESTTTVDWDWLI